MWYLSGVEGRQAKGLNDQETCMEDVNLTASHWEAIHKFRCNLLYKAWINLSVQTECVWEHYKYVYMTTNCDFNFQWIHQNLCPGWQRVKLSNSVLTIGHDPKEGLQLRHSDWQTTGLTWDGHFTLKRKTGVLKTSAILSLIPHNAIIQEQTLH
jgi:hypothetical protein